MEVVAKKKPSYEELENELRECKKQFFAVCEQANNLNVANAFKRLDYLFKCLDYKEMFSEGFIKDCSLEIQNIMIIQDKKPNESK